LHGRKVYDGGGITPDILLEVENMSNITYSLLAKNLVFDYATYYVAEKEAPASLESFSFTNQDYADFLKFLQDKDYDYTTQSDDKLVELIETAKEEKYYDSSSGEFEALKKKLAHDKEKDLQTFRDEIRNYIEGEIACRYYYQKGRIQVSLNDDKEITKAIEVLKNPKAYATLLQGPNYENDNDIAGIR